MLSTNSNFAFIRSFPSLYIYASKAEKYYNTDHLCCALNLRIYAEIAAHHLLHHRHCSIELTGSFKEKLHLVQSMRAAPSHILGVLHALRLAGNHAAHVTWEADSEGVPCLPDLPKMQVLQLLKGAFEVAEYLFVVVGNGCRLTIPTWQAPSELLPGDLYQRAYEGDCESCYTLGQRLNEDLQRLFVSRRGMPSRALRKHREELLTDSLYWLNRGARKGHLPSQLLLAQLHSGSLNTPHNKELAQKHFKAAVKEEDGESLYHYACYLKKHQKGQKWLRLMKQSASAEHLPAVEFLQGHYQSQDRDSYLQFVEQGVALGHGSSMVIKLAELDWQEDVAQIRSLITAGLTLRHGAISWLHGHFLFHGLCGYPQDQPRGFELMKQHVDEVPEAVALLPASNTFLASVAIKAERSEQFALAEAAVPEVRNQAIEGDLLYLASQVSLGYIDALVGYRGHLFPNELIARAVELGNGDAIKFQQSDYGKAKLSGFITIGRPKNRRRA